MDCYLFDIIMASIDNLHCVDRLAIITIKCVLYIMIPISETVSFRTFSNNEFIRTLKNLHKFGMIGDPGKKQIKRYREDPCCVLP